MNKENIMIKKDLPRWLWILLALVSVILLGWIDWKTGYHLNFFVFYFLPVSLAAWFVGRNASVVMAILATVVWFGADTLSGNQYPSHFYAVWNTIMRLVSILIIGWMVSRIRFILDRERQLSDDLRQALYEVKALEAFLPICCECKKIRNQEGHWEQLESYLGEHAGTTFSHSYCPDCAKKAMAEARIIAK